MKINSINSVYVQRNSAIKKMQADKNVTKMKNEQMPADTVNFKGVQGAVNGGMLGVAVGWVIGGVLGPVGWIAMAGGALLGGASGAGIGHAIQKKLGS